MVDFKTNIQVYGYFVLFRIINALLIQSQFDPDEYWQNLEPAYCHVFHNNYDHESLTKGKKQLLLQEQQQSSSCAGLTWEWKRGRPTTTTTSFESLTMMESLNDIIMMGMHGPVRSYISVLPTIIFYYFLKYCSLDTTYLVSKGPILLNAILVAAPTDWAVWYISSRWLSSSSSTTSNDDSTTTGRSYLASWCIFCTLSSWFWAYALVRTYSNSLETAIMALSLVFVAKEFIGYQVNNDNDDKTTTRFWRSRFAFFLGGICCSIRFTALAAYIPMGIILAIQEGGSTLQFCFYLLSICAIPGFIGLMLTLILDRFFYGFWAIPFLGNIHFNVILGNGSLYGTHPIHWYLTSGIPAITGVMFPFLIVSFASRWCIGERNIWILCLCYAVTHSFSEHKEFRFMLPLLPLFCLIAGKKMTNLIGSRSSKIRKPFMIVVSVINLLVFLFLGTVHQRGVIDVNLKIVELVKHEPQTYMVHYLLGCHSTPLLSHLHTPPIRFETWTLDCSPDCRSDPKAQCESDAFEKNPEEFAETTYFQEGSCVLEEGTCVTDLRLLYPDYLITKSEYLPKLKSRLATMGMKEVARFTNGIDGVRLPGSKVLGSESCSSGQSTELALFNTTSLCFDEIVLFESKGVKPRY